MSCVSFKLTNDFWDFVSKKLFDYICVLFRFLADADWDQVAKTCEIGHPYHKSKEEVGHPHPVCCKY